MENKQEVKQLYEGLIESIQGKVFSDVLVAFGAIVADIAYSNNIHIFEALGRMNASALETYDELKEEEDESTRH